MKAIVGSIALLSSFTLLAVGCGEDQADDLTNADEALLTCDGWHHGNPGHHRGHHHFRHHHGHPHGGAGGAAGSGGAPHLPPPGGSTGTGGAAGSGMAGSGGSDMGGTAGTGPMVDPRCAPVSGIISWWHADGDYDDAVGSNDGNTAGAVGFAPGADNQGFSLSGAENSFVEVPDDPSLMTTGAVTMDAWIFQTTMGGRIIDKAQAFGRNGYMMDVAGDQLRLFVSGDAVISTDHLPAGVFTHVAGVYDGTHLGVYINGALSGEEVTGPMTPNNLPLRMGGDSLGGSLFVGIIDEPRVFNRALTADEIALLFWQGNNCR
jgi:concanavalin A-like lectin/glucanase superfamily protein